MSYGTRVAATKVTTETYNDGSATAIYVEGLFVGSTPAKKLADERADILRDIIARLIDEGRKDARAQFDTRKALKRIGVDGAAHMAEWRKKRKKINRHMQREGLSE